MDWLGIIAFSFIFMVVLAFAVYFGILYLFRDYH